MPKSEAPEPDLTRCKYCKEEMKEGKCPNQKCGAWTDSYGLLHRGGCPGGFHEECPE